MPGNRVALVIGIDHYARGSGPIFAPDLNNPVKDAQAMRDTLGKLGFAVVYGEDLGKDDFETALDRFEDRAKDADIAIVYFSGHGSTFEGLPYLVPADATFEELRQTERKLIRVEDVLERLREAKGVRIALFDACRDDEAEQALKQRMAGTKAVAQTRGLARVQAPPDGLIVMYAAQFLQTADDGTAGGDHSPFAAALLDKLPTPGENITAMLEDVARSVIDLTGGKQKPELVVDLFDKFQLVESTEPAPPPVAATDARIAEAALVWPSLASSNDAALLRAFKLHYAGTVFEEMASARLAELASNDVKEPAASQSSGETPGIQIALVPGVPGVVVTRVSTPLNACDSLAGALLDPDHVGPGIDKDKLVPANAIPACQEAAKNSPSTRRFLFQLGRAYNASKDYSTAISWYRKAADLGSTAAMGNIGFLYDYGDGVTQNSQEAAIWFRKAADLGNPVSIDNLGVLYEKGRGVEQDFQQAMTWYRRAADLQYPFAIYHVGSLYENGQGVATDYKQAMSWFMKAAALNDVAAMVEIGYLYEDGRGVPVNYQEAMTWYGKAANLGNAEAMSNLGSLYEKGRGVSRDYNQAMSWYRKAADLGNVSAMAEIGYFYDAGLAVGQDYQEALSWYRKAADLGNGYAMVKVGFFYDTGLAVGQDYTEAMSWYRKASDLGVPEAINNIGVLYEDGHGVQMDYLQAVTWFRRASDLGYSAAADNLRAICSSRKGLKGC
ncbi:hypothetical protein GCM10007874_22660 [Labrys miyagiensis]|uniref:Caspase family p20 domain-containing protein n=2 Tax=Labrys miyagiensis TaxID=346912 RepID=A0ABQ6CHJ8_9HYPH|nr:hypothetical protein GCM10007874_22660 [Labrys miyagiensis]